MNTLGEPYRIVLRYLQPYERQIIELIESRPITMHTGDLMYHCARDGWEAPLVLFTANYEKIVAGAIEGGHYELYLKYHKGVGQEWIIEMAATHGRLHILQQFSYYANNVFEAAIKNCHLECVQHIYEAYQRQFMVLNSNCCRYIDYTNPRARAMIVYLQKCLQSDQFMSRKKLQIAEYTGDIETLKLYHPSWFDDLVPTISGGHMPVLMLILEHVSVPFLACAAKYGRTDMMQLAITRGETDYNAAANSAIPNDHAAAITVLLPHITNQIACFELACKIGAIKIVALLAAYATPKGLTLAKLYRQEAVVDLINSKFLEA